MGFKSGMPAGNVNLKGKKSKVLSCRCCEAINHKDKHQKMLDIKEMRKYKGVVPVGGL